MGIYSRRAFNQVNTVINRHTVRNTREFNGVTYISRHMTCSLAMVYRIFFPGECKSWNAEWNGIWNGIWNDKLSNKKN